MVIFLILLFAVLLNLVSSSVLKIKKKKTDYCKNKQKKILLTQLTMHGTTLVDTNQNITHQRITVFCALLGFIVCAIHFEILATVQVMWK